MDDTGLNSVQLRCVSKDGSINDGVISYDGIWGDWKTQQIDDEAMAMVYAPA